MVNFIPSGEILQYAYFPHGFGSHGLNGIKLHLSYGFPENPFLQ